MAFCGDLPGGAEGQGRKEKGRGRKRASQNREQQTVQKTNQVIEKWMKALEKEKAESAYQKGLNENLLRIARKGPMRIES